MTTKVKQAKMTWSPDEPGTVWGYPANHKPGLSPSYFLQQAVSIIGGPRWWAWVYPPGCNGHKAPLGMFRSQREAKAACAVDALKYL